MGIHLLRANVATAYIKFWICSGRAQNKKIVSWYILFNITYSKVERALLLNLGDVLINLDSISSDLNEYSIHRVCRSYRHAVPYDTIKYQTSATTEMGRTNHHNVGHVTSQQEWPTTPSWCRPRDLTAGVADPNTHACMRAFVHIDTVGCWTKSGAAHDIIRTIQIKHLIHYRRSPHYWCIPLYFYFLNVLYSRHNSISVNLFLVNLPFFLIFPYFALLHDWYTVLIIH